MNNAQKCLVSQKQKNTDFVRKIEVSLVVRKARYWFFPIGFLQGKNPNEVRAGNKALKCWLQVIRKDIFLLTVIEDTGTYGAGDGIEQMVLKWELTLHKRSLDPNSNQQSTKHWNNTCLYISIKACTACFISVTKCLA